MGGEDLSNLSYAERFINNTELSQFFSFQLQYSEKLSPQPVTLLPQFLEEYFARGGEGVVLMDSSASYAFGKRPVRASVKIKKQLADFEAKVINTLEPNRLYEGKELENWEYWIERNTPDFSRPEFFSEKQCNGKIRVKSINFLYSSNQTLLLWLEEWFRM